MTPEHFYDALSRWLPARVRLWLYVVALATLAVVAAWLGIDGARLEALGALAYALLFGVAATKAKD